MIEQRVIREDETHVFWDIPEKKTAYLQWQKTVKMGKRNAKISKKKYEKKMRPKLKSHPP